MPNPPTIDRALLQELADLARLHVPADRQPLLRARLDRIVAAFHALAEVEGLPAAAPPVDRPLPLRPDVAEAPLPAAQVLANAPQHAAGMFVVPRVVDA